jgi:16S rRNA processing protein RimM
MNAAAPASQWVTLALLKRPQGRRGELLAELLTDFPDRFTERPHVFLAAPGFNGSAAEARPIEIAGHWLPVGRNQGRVVLAFVGIDSISQAEQLAGLEVIVPITARVELEEDEEYVSDLIGCAVIQRAGSGQETRLGVVAGVEFPTTSDGTRRLEDAAPLLTVIDDANDEILIPYVQAFLISVSTTAKVIHMNLPDGLLDLNKPAVRVVENMSGSGAEKGQG